jgi:hypothetical protein
VCVLRSCVFFFTMTIWQHWPPKKSGRKSNLTHTWLYRRKCVSAPSVHGTLCSTDILESILPPPPISTLNCIPEDWSWETEWQGFAMLALAPCRRHEKGYKICLF